MVVRTVDITTGEVMEREYTQEELDAIANAPAPTPPSPLEQIRALERQYADDTAKVTRQTLLMAVVKEAMERPEVVAMLQGYQAEAVKAQVITTLMDSDPGFKLMYELEQAMEPLRAQIP